MFSLHKDSKMREGQEEWELLLSLWARAKDWLDYHVSRNQVFHSMRDYVWAMIFCISLNRRSMFRCADMLGKYGVFSFIPFILTAFVLRGTIFFADVFAGFFPGSGIVDTTRKMCPLLSGVGMSYIMYGAYQLMRDYYDLSLITFHLSRSTKGAIRVACNRASFYSINGVYHHPACYNLRCIFHTCGANFSADLRPLPDYNIYTNVHQPGSFAGGLMVTSLLLMAAAFFLSLFSVRKFTRGVCFVILPVVLLELVFLIAAGLQFRIVDAPKNARCDIWADVKRMLAWKTFRESSADFRVWLDSSSVVLSMLAIATGITTGVSRRTAQGQSLDLSTLRVTMSGIIIHIIFAFAYVIASPRVLTKDGAYSYAEYSRLYAWDWVLYASETFQLTYLGQWAVLVMGLSIFLCVFARIFYIIDTLRNAVAEKLVTMGVEETSIDDWRARLAPVLLTFAFLLGVGRFYTPKGAVFDEWTRAEETEMMGRLLCGAFLIVVLYGVYEERRVAKDIYLVTRNRFQARFSLFRAYNRLLGTCICPIYTTAMLAGYIYVTYEGSYFTDSTDLLYNNLSQSEVKAAMVVRWLYCLLPLVPVVRSVVSEILSALYHRSSLKTTIHPTKDWGPSEIRFWEQDRRYKHLFFDYGGMLDEEREELLGDLRKVQGRHDTRLSRHSKSKKKNS